MCLSRDFLRRASLITSISFSEAMGMSSFMVAVLDTAKAINDGQIIVDHDKGTLRDQKGNEL